MEKIITESETGTLALGKKLGRACRGGEVFLLCGELGAGKTKLVQGLAQGLGVRGRVNSPTFNILKLYPATGAVKSFCHIDAYRLDSVQSLLDLGLAEFLDSATTVTAIEWAQKIKKIWPPGARVLELRVLSEKQREIKIFSNS